MEKGFNIFKKVLCCLLLFTFFTKKNIAQSFYRDKTPKIISYHVGLGVGTFFAASRPSYDSIVNSKMPVLSLGLGKRIGNHLSLKSTFSFQPFSSREYQINEDGSSSLEPIFDGFNYAIDITPTFNLLPSYHHMSRPIVDFSLGLGLGYLLTYRTEKFYFDEKYFEFNLFEHSVYIPVRANLSFRLGKVSDLSVEGAFFNTSLDRNREIAELKRDSDHFAQFNLMYRRFLW